MLEGFRSVLPHGVYPVAFLFLEIPLEEVDVNVHPAKTEVRFRRSNAVKDVVAEAVRDALRSAGILTNSELDFGNSDFSEDQTQESFLSELKIQTPLPEQTKMDFQVEDKNADFMPRFSESENVDETVSQTFETEKEIIEEIPATSEDFESVAQTRENQTAEVFDLQNFNPNRKFEISQKFQIKSEPFLYEQIQNPKSEIQNPLPPVDSAEKIPKAVEVGEVSSSKIRPIGQLARKFYYRG